MAKCTKAGWCPGLERVFTEANRKGINPVVTTKLSGSVQVIGVAYKTKESDRGVMLNFCPFCGADISYKSQHGT